MFAQDADTIGLSSEEREEVVKDGVDNVDEEVDDEQMNEVFSAKVVEAMRSNDYWGNRGFNNWRSCAGGHVYLVGRSFKLPYSPLATYMYMYMMLTYVSVVVVPVSRGLVLPTAATR